MYIIKKQKLSQVNGHASFVHIKTNKVGVQVYLHLTWFMTIRKLNGTGSFFFPRIKGPAIIYRRWARAEDFGGYHWIFRMNDGGSVITEIPKGRSQNATCLQRLGGRLFDTLA